MRTNTYILYAKATLAALMAAPLLWALPACSDNKGEEVLPEEEERLYTVTLSLNPSTRGAVTRADEPYWGTDPELERYERYIDNCVVAIFQGGEWVASLSSGVGGEITIDNSGTVTTDNSTSVGTASVELPAGTYTFYAFANLTSLNIGEETAGTTLINELVTGKTSTGSTLTEDALKEKAVSLGNDLNRFNPDDDIYIPMSSYGKTKVLDSDASLVITLFRMLGKVTVEINNQTSGDLTLKSLEMGNFRRGNIFLVPYGSGKTSLDNLTQNDKDSFNPDLPDDMNAKTESRTLTIEEDQQKIAKDMKASFTFYEFETDVESQTKAGFIGSMWLSTGITGRVDAPQELVDFSFMRRNDWLNIPVQILETDLVTTVSGTRMPIGGTPRTIEYPANGAFIPVLHHTVDYPGEITIGFTFSLDANEGFGNVKFEFEPVQHEAGLQYTEATLVDNANGLLYDATTQAALANGEITVTETATGGASATATMKLTTQELSYEGTAKIDLTLVVSYTNGSESGKITVPYTITLTNGKEAKQEVEGGN